jgi:hypothetical protein
VDIEQRLRRDADALDRQMAGMDVAGFLADTFAKLDDLDHAPHPTSAATAACPADSVGWASAPPLTGGDLGVDQGSAQRLLTYFLHSAETEGDGWSCRQVAELLEVQGRTEDAWAWWQRAAAAGDEDAQDYLDETMTN